MTEQSTYRTNRDLFSNHYLNDHLRKTEPWNEVPDADVEEAFTEIRDLWLEKEDRVDDYNEAQLEKNFIRPIFDILDVPFEIEQTVKRNARRPDYGFFASTEAADAAFDREDFYEEAVAVADAKRWGRKLDTRGKEKRDFENPSYQIHRYLQETPTHWAVLTNGEKWRLYYGPTSHRLDSYYEIDLPKLIDSVAEEDNIEAFKEFYLFFRQKAFLPDQSGDCFLDDVYTESSVFAEDLGEDLQENIYEAIRVLAEGFLDTNDDLDEDDLDLVHDSSLIYLYRLIFVLYAESEGRNLLPTDNDIYSGSYSLNELKQTVVENRSKTQKQYQTWQTDLWDRLDQLFVLIDQGSKGQDIPKEDLYIPAYNGGLFRTDPDDEDSQEAIFLSNHEVGDAYIAEVIELLTRHDASEGEGKVFVDYSSLDERNLGSIYEGLLEYKLDVADEPLTVDDGEYSPAGEGDNVTVEEGDVYLRTDDGERKATGSYYTPEYVVEYIVDETLGPLVNEIREDMLAESARGDERGFAEEFADRVFDLTVLDPAMGSGHFPVNAVDYLAREIIDAQEQQDRQALDSADAEVRAPTTKEGELRDINWARRKVAQRCIYGVDVNPLATELAKVSLWLRTLAAEQPLAFLDHHLKTGNSLVGSDIEDVLSDGDDETETEDGQLTLQQSFDHTRQRAMEHVTDRFQDLLNIDNETLEDAKEMEAVYDDVRADPLYKKLLAMANVHTADAFGLDVPGDADERMARALHSEAWENIEEQDWFKSAQAMAEDERFFHWELEFPMAFYDQDGERKADAGFDAVIGNPPYLKSHYIPKTLDNYLRDSFETADEGAYDMYVPFLELAHKRQNATGRAGYILPNKFFEANYGEALRNYLVQERCLDKVVNFGEKQVFDGVSTYTSLVFLDSSISETEYFSVSDLDAFAADGDTPRAGAHQVYSLNDLGEKWNFFTGKTAEIMEQVSEFPTLNDASERIFKGLDTGMADFYAVEKRAEDTDTYVVYSEQSEAEVRIEKELLKPLLKGKDIEPYSPDYQDRLLFFPYRTDAESYKLMSESVLESKYPLAYDYLIQHEDELRARQDGAFDDEKWFRFTNPRNLHHYTENKICSPYNAFSPEFIYDTSDFHFTTGFAGAYGTITDEDSTDFHRGLTAILNSTFTKFFMEKTSTPMRGNYFSYEKRFIKDIPIPLTEFNTDKKKREKESADLKRRGENYITGSTGAADISGPLSDVDDKESGAEIILHALGEFCSKTADDREQRRQLNLDLLDYLGNYTEGPNLPDVGLFQPTGSNILDATTEEYEKLQIERTRARRNGSTITIEATARYKPEDDDEFETDTYGYTETNFFKAFTLTDLNKKEAALVEAFVPVAVDEEIGGFRDNATKNNSLIDRLKGIILPDPDDVADDLRRYLETKERADELDEKIEKTDQLIDEIVYDLYGLTNEEIEILEEAVDDD